MKMLAEAIEMPRWEHSGSYRSSEKLQIRLEVRQHAPSFEACSWHSSLSRQYFPFFNSIKLCGTLLRRAAWCNERQMDWKSHKLFSYVYSFSCLDISSRRYDKNSLAKALQDSVKSCFLDCLSMSCNILRPDLITCQLPLKKIVGSTSNQFKLDPFELHAL